ncbi:MAG: hypothetical protein ACI4JB_02840, partial [Porcipelethomonas sp.]
LEITGIICYNKITIFGKDGALMGISPINAGVGIYPESGSGGSVKQTIDELKNQRRELEDQLSKSGTAELQNRISTLDKRIGNLESRVNKVTGEEECQTCKERKYKDGSDDPGVSFKTASKISPENVASAVRGHENEHVIRERAQAQRENKEVVSQTVTLKSDICPECGKSYISGGETVTVTKSKPENPYNVGIPDESEQYGRILNSSI